MADNPTLENLPKVDADFKSELEKFSNNLKPTNTQEKVVLPTAEDVAAEKTQQALLQGVEGFDTNKLKPTDTQEKVVLPSQQDVAAEKTQQALLKGVEGFDTNKLKPTDTQEKVFVTVIDQEKSV